MSGAPAFSVVIRNFNRRERVGRAIASALAQDHPSFEVVVVDDGSSDGSPDLIAERFGGEERLRLFALAHNRGAAAAANAGIAAAGGRHVAFLDSDDAFLPGCLRAHEAALAASPEALVSYCDYIQVFEPYGLERPMRCGSPGCDPRAAMLKGGFIHSQSMTVTLKSAVLALGGFDEDLAVSHDFDLWLRLALEADHPFVHVRRALVRHAISADGVTARDDLWWREAVLALRRARAHPRAAPYADDQAARERRLGELIAVRRTVRDWLERIAPRRIAVIMPPGGGTAARRRSIASVLDQDHEDFELLLAGGEGGDGGDAGDGRLVAVAVPEGAGAETAVDHAARAATGTVLAFILAGEMFPPGYLRAVARAHSFPIEAPVFAHAESEHPAGASPGGEACSGALLHDYLWAPYPATLSALSIDRALFLELGGLAADAGPLALAGLGLRALEALGQTGRRAHALGPPVRLAGTRILGMAEPGAEGRDPEGAAEALLEGFGRRAPANALRLHRGDLAPRLAALARLANAARARIP